MEGNRRRARFERSFGPAEPHDPEHDYAPATRRTKQLIVLAADAVLARIPPDKRAADVADELVANRVLPGCYRTRYDQRFLQIFRSITEVVRNLLVSDLPFVPDTASELAANAIMDQAEAILDAGGNGWRQQAAEIDAGLPEQLSARRGHLADDLEWLRETALEDTDVLLLFDLPATDDPVANLEARLREGERELLEFENWRTPFGNPPRPHVTYDGRAWPVAF